MNSQHRLASAFGSTVVAGLVEAHIQQRLIGRLRNLQVIVGAEGLIIKGHSRTYHVKQLAQHAAAEVSPMPVVANEIEVS